MQAQLKNCKHNKTAYERITKMVEANHPTTAEQCREKVKKLKLEYRKIKNFRNINGRGRRNWIYFEAMDQTFGHKHTSEPPVVMDTSDHQYPAPIKGETGDDDAKILSISAPGSSSTPSLANTSTTSGSSSNQSEETPPATSVSKQHF